MWFRNELSSLAEVSLCVYIYIYIYIYIVHKKDKSKYHNTHRCLFTRVQRNIVKGSAKNRNSPDKRFQNTEKKKTKQHSKYRGNFCLTIGNTAVISVYYEPPLLFSDLPSLTYVEVRRDMKNSCSGSFMKQITDTGRQMVRLNVKRRRIFLSCQTSICPYGPESPSPPPKKNLLPHAQSQCRRSSPPAYRHEAEPTPAQTPSDSASAATC